MIDPHVQYQKFSVVIASHGREKLLVSLIESLNQAKSSTHADVEIIVVDSTPAAKASDINKACAELGVTLINGPKSVRRKRNLGAETASGNWLFFVDSDCEVSPEIFNSYLRIIESNPEFTAGAGPTVFRGGETSFTKRIEHSSLQNPFRQPTEEKQLLWATTSNLLVRKDVFDDLNGFKVNLPFKLGGDDTDFCLRLRDKSHKLISVPEAVCYHSWTTWSRPLSVVRRSFRWGWMQSYLLREFPQYRRIDTPGLPVHTLACLIIAGVLAIFGNLYFLAMPVIFVLLAVLFHAFAVSIRASKPLSMFVKDITLAIVELPFGFGRALGSLARFSLVGLFFRLDVDDTGAYKVFPNNARALLCDNFAFICVALFAGWIA